MQTSVLSKISKQVWDWTLRHQWFLFLAPLAVLAFVMTYSTFVLSADIDFVAFSYILFIYLISFPLHELGHALVAWYEHTFICFCFVQFKGGVPNPAVASEQVKHRFGLLAGIVITLPLILIIPTDQQLSMLVFFLLAGSMDIYQFAKYPSCNKESILKWLETNKIMWSYPDFFESEFYKRESTKC